MFTISSTGSLLGSAPECWGNEGGRAAPSTDGKGLLGAGPRSGSALRVGGGFVLICRGWGEEDDDDEEGALSAGRGTKWGKRLKYAGGHGLCSRISASTTHHWKSR